MLPKALEHLSGITSLDEKSKTGLHKVIRVWEERGVYDAKQIAEFKAVLGSKFIIFILELVAIPFPWRFCL